MIKKCEICGNALSNGNAWYYKDKKVCANCLKSLSPDIWAEIETEAAKSKGEFKIMFCLKCGAELPLGSKQCSECGLTLDGVKLYDPKHFPFLAILFSAMVPIYLSASNWGRLGNPQRKRKLLVIGFAGLLVFSTVLMLLPFSASSGKYIGFLINLPIGFFLREYQRSVYKTALFLGAKPASTVTGTLKGIAVTVLAVLIAILGITAYTDYETKRGIMLIREEKCEEAEVVFKRLLSLDTSDEYVKFNLAICYLCMEKWDEAVDNLNAYLQHHSDDPNAHVYLGIAFEGKGMLKEAQQHYETAQSLDPEVMDSFFGEP